MWQASLSGNLAAAAWRSAPAGSVPAIPGLIPYPGRTAKEAEGKLHELDGFVDRAPIAPFALGQFGIEIPFDDVNNPFPTAALPVPADVEATIKSTFGNYVGLYTWIQERPSVTVREVVAQAVGRGGATAILRSELSRPDSAHSRRRAAIRSATADTPSRLNPYQPSPHCAIRCSAVSPLPPRMMGIILSRSGFGFARTKSKSTNPPWNEATSSRQRVRSTDAYSAVRTARRAKGMPSASNSSRAQQMPTPNASRHRPARQSGRHRSTGTANPAGPPSPRVHPPTGWRSHAARRSRPPRRSPNEWLRSDAERMQSDVHPTSIPPTTFGNARNRRTGGLFSAFPTERPFRRGWATGRGIWR